MPLSYYQVLRITTAACACHCVSHRRPGDRTSVEPQCATRLPASAAGGLCPACAKSHAACAGGVGACTHQARKFRPAKAVGP
jgi:hypothetical protein